MGDREPAVKTKVALVDPRTMSLVWTNEADSPAPAAVEHAPGLPVEAFLPMADTLGLPDVLKEVAETGAPRHLSADIVSTSRGSVQFVASVYRLPDGMLLVVAQNAWHVSQKEHDVSGTRRHTRRSRSE